MHRSDRTVNLAVDSGVAHIELHRPKTLNSWTPVMGRQLLDAVRLASSDAGVRSVLVTGAGPAFSAGADVKAPRELTPDGVPDLSTRLRTIYNPIMLAIRESPKPFVAAVHGACAGLGVSLALACDFLLAADDTFFLLAFVGIGVMPDGGATAFLAERVGFARAAELCLLGERLGAADALKWGLVHAVLPRNEISSQARELAQRMADAEPTELGRIKLSLIRGELPALRGQLALEAELQQRHGGSHDYAEGRAAFAAKRPPKFIGG